MKLYHFLLFYCVSIVVWIGVAFLTSKMNSKLGRTLDPNYFRVVSIAGLIIMMIISINMFYFHKWFLYLLVGSRSSDLSQTALAICSDTEWRDRPRVVWRRVDDQKLPKYRSHLVSEGTANITPRFGKRWWTKLSGTLWASNRPHLARLVFEREEE